MSTTPDVASIPYEGCVDEEMGRAVWFASVTRNHSRDLVADLRSTAPLGPALREGASQATATLHRSVDTMAEARTRGSEGVYVRSSSLYDRAERLLEHSAVGLGHGCPAIRGLQSIDDSVAAMAELIELEVTDFDTSQAV